MNRKNVYESRKLHHVATKKLKKLDKTLVVLPEDCRLQTIHK